MSTRTKGIDGPGQDWYQEANKRGYHSNASRESMNMWMKWWQKNRHQQKGLMSRLQSQNW